MAAELHLYHVRHGEYSLNVRKSRIAGRSNAYDLNHTGQEQAKAIGRAFKAAGIRFDAWFSTPAQRGLQTGASLLHSLGQQLEPVIDDRLQEVSQGKYEDKHKVTLCNPVLWRGHLQYMMQPMIACLPEGESLSEATERMNAFVDEQLAVFKNDQTQPSQHILVTGHGQAIRCEVGNRLGWTAKQIRDGRWTPNASVTEEVYKDNELKVVSVGALTLPHVPVSLAKATV